MIRLSNYKQTRKKEVLCEYNVKYVPNFLCNFGILDDIDFNKNLSVSSPKGINYMGAHPETIVILLKKDCFYLSTEIISINLNYIIDDSLESLCI